MPFSAVHFQFFNEVLKDGSADEFEQEIERIVDAMEQTTIDEKATFKLFAGSIKVFFG